MRIAISFALWFVCLFGPHVDAQHVEFVSNLPYNESLSDVWHFVAPDTIEYALVGVYNGLSIVSLDDPTDPEEVLFVSGPESIWRDIKTWGNHAYVTNETSGGLLIVDLTNLPLSVDTVTYRERGLSSAHNLFIDENGIAYVVGANIDNGGATMLDLTADPMDPVFTGAYDTRYVHDIYVRNDTMYTAEIAWGEFAIVDVSDKSNPVILATQHTPMGFSHNTWLSDDGSILAVTEEYPAGFTVTYDVSDPTDINELGRFRSDWDVGVIPHNTYFLNNWLVTSSYSDGITIVDASRPRNLVETGRFDTSPVPSQASFNGCWGVDPFLPSGLILASDIEEGLFVLEPHYKPAAWLEGTVRNESTGSPIIYSRIELIGTSTPDYITDFTGRFFTGNVDSGLYMVRVAASGCLTEIFPGVELIPGQVTTLEPMLSCTSTAVIEPGKEKIAVMASPSPTFTDFALEWNFPAEIWDGSATYEVFDPAGRKVESGLLKSRSGSVRLGADWPSGYYMIRTAVGKSSGLVRLVKR